MNHDRLLAMVKTFVAPGRQKRLLTFLDSPRRYADFLHHLLHDPRHFDPAVVERLRGSDRSLPAVRARLAKLGVRGEAYLVGDCDPYFDGHVGSADDLLAACVGSMEDALVYFWQDAAAYYEGHEGFGYILRRPSTAERGT